MRVLILLASLVCFAASDPTLLQQGIDVANSATTGSSAGCSDQPMRRRWVPSCSLLKRWRYCTYMLNARRRTWAGEVALYCKKSCNQCTPPPRRRRERRRRAPPPPPPPPPVIVSAPSAVSTPSAVGVSVPPVPKPSVPVTNVNNNDAKGTTNMKGLDMLGSFFDMLAGLCVPPMTGNHADAIIIEICKYIPKFGLVWNKPGNSTTTTSPTCNVFGCQCHLFALDAAKKFFWFGLWVPPSLPMAVFSWSGGGICLSLRVNSAGNGIQAGTGALKLQTSLFDIMGNFLCQGRIKSWPCKPHWPY